MRTRRLLLAAALTLAAAAGCADRSDTPDVPAQPFGILASSENQPLEPIIQEYAEREDIDVQVTYRGSVDIMRELANGAVSALRRRLAGPQHLAAARRHVGRRPIRRPASCAPRSSSASSGRWRNGSVGSGADGHGRRHRGRRRGGRPPPRDDGRRPVGLRRRGLPRLPLRLRRPPRSPHRRASPSAGGARPDGAHPRPGRPLGRRFGLADGAVPDLLRRLRCDGELRIGGDRGQPGVGRAAGANRSTRSTRSRAR